MVGTDVNSPPGPPIRDRLFCAILGHLMASQGGREQFEESDTQYCLKGDMGHFSAREISAADRIRAEVAALGPTTFRRRWAVITTEREEGTGDPVVEVHTVTPDRDAAERKYEQLRALYQRANDPDVVNGLRSRADEHEEAGNTRMAEQLNTEADDLENARGGEAHLREIEVA